MREQRHPRQKKGGSHVVADLGSKKAAEAKVNERVGAGSAVAKREGVAAKEGGARESLHTYHRGQVVSLPLDI